MFPTLASDELIARWPPTILISAEWDAYIIPHNRFSRKLKKNERLLENIVYPGANHAFFLNFRYKLTHTFWYDFKKLISTYLLQQGASSPQKKDTPKSPMSPKSPKSPKASPSPKKEAATKE